MNFITTGVILTTIVSGIVWFRVRYAARMKASQARVAALKAQFSDL